MYIETLLDDNEMARTLQEEGWQLASARLVRSIRTEQGWVRRDRGDEEWKEAKYRRTYEAVKDAIQDGIARVWGRTHLYTYLRTHHPEIRPRKNDVQQALANINEELGRQRNAKFKKARRDYAVFNGPDEVWSVDGHEKLSNWGIEIYACIDAHSRRILWWYAGTANRKQVSVAKQFIKAVDAYKIVPRRIRADRGTETTLMADLQFQQRRQHLVKTGQCTEDDLDEEDKLREYFRSCFIYGTSVRNIRIESWWSRLEAYQLRPWLVSYSRKCEQCTKYHILATLWVSRRPLSPDPQDVKGGEASSKSAHSLESYFSLIIAPIYRSQSCGLVKRPERGN